MKEKRLRSIIKTITWRAIATITTIILVYIFTGRIDWAITVGGIEVVLKLFFYYVHERFWGKIKWGKH